MDVWKIGVAMSLTNGMSPVIAVIAKDVLGLKGKVKDVETAFKSWKPAIAGALSILAGGAMIGAVAKLAKAGGDVNHQLELMKAAGMKNAEIFASQAQAMKTMAAVQTTTFAGNLEHIRELRYAFGHTNEANQYLSQVTRSNAVLNAVKGGGTDQVWELVKSLEQKGLTTDPQAFMQYVNDMTKVVEATGGRVTPAMYMQSIKYGRTAALGWDESFITGALPRLIQSMSGGGTGGGRAGPGNALMSAFAKVVQGQMSKKSAEEFNRLGLTTRYSPIKGSSQALVDIAGSKMFTANPYEWVQTVLMPALSKNGITSQQDIIQEISRLFQVRTASQVITEMGLQGRFHEGANSPFEKDINLQKGAAALAPSYADLSKNDYVTVMKEFNAQLKSLMQVLGGPAAQLAIPVMKGFTDAITSITQVASAHPTALKIVTEAVAGLGIALVGLGAAAVVGAAISVVGPVAAAVAAIAGIVGTIAALNWKAVANVFTGIYNAIKDFIHNIVTLGGLLSSSHPSSPSSGIAGGHQFSTNPNPHPTGGIGGLFHHSSYVPPAPSGQPMVVHTAINLDGRRMGHAVSTAMARNSSWSDNSSSFDGSAMAPVTDQSMI